MYILDSGNSLIPQQPNRKKKLKASFQMSFARIQSDYLKFCTNLLRNFKKEDLEKDLVTMLEDVNEVIIKHFLILLFLIKIS